MVVVVVNGWWTNSSGPWRLGGGKAVVFRFATVSVCVVVT